MAKIGIAVKVLNEAVKELESFRSAYVGALQNIANNKSVIENNLQEVIASFDGQRKLDFIRKSSQYADKTARLFASLIVISMQDDIESTNFSVAQLSPTTIRLKGHDTPFIETKAYIQHILLHKEEDGWFAGVSDGNMVTKMSMGREQTVDIGEYAVILEYGDPEHKLPSGGVSPIPPRPIWNQFFMVRLPELLVKSRVTKEVEAIWSGQQEINDILKE